MSFAEPLVVTGTGIPDGTITVPREPKRDPRVINVSQNTMSHVARMTATKSLGGPALAKAMMFANFPVEHVAIAKSDIRKPNAAARRAARIAAGKLKVVDGALVGA